MRSAVFVLLGWLFAVAGAASEPVWRGTAPRPEGGWIWEISFPTPRRIGALGQVLGDHPFVLRHAPKDYEWQATVDGLRWSTISGTWVHEERRMIRLFRLSRSREYLGLRLVVRTATDLGPPAVGRLDLLETPEGAWPVAPWILVVNSTDDPALPGHGQEFIPLARSCPGWGSLGAQQIWVPDLDKDLIDIDPPPLAVFLSGSFKDWCEVDRRHWAGVEGVLRRGRDPIWASCGGAQALAILADRGTRRPWDCPHCRDPRRPRLPIYGHIGHRTAGPHRCGDYTDCHFERGPHAVRAVTADPVFTGLPDPFKVMESHCGQIEYAPANWQIIAVGGPGTRTANQCLRLRDRPIYAAQFHIEMEGTPESSGIIMANFLEAARGYRDWPMPPPATRRWLAPP